MFSPTAKVTEVRWSVPVATVVPTSPSKEQAHGGLVHAVDPPPVPVPGPPGPPGPWSGHVVLPGGYGFDPSGPH